MATTLIVKTQFTAIDKFTSVVKKMTAATRTFASKAVVAFNRVERAERKLRRGISKTVGKLGQLGIAFSALAVGMLVASANLELEKNLASLSAITGVTGENFKAFEKQIDAVSKSQRRFAGDTAKAFEIVGSAKPELLANAEALGKVTEASIILSKAAGTDLAVSADNLTGTMNQFNLAANEASRVINVLAAGSQAGSAPIDQITESMKKFGAVANSTGVSLEESVGLIETLAIKQIKGAEAGTALRNILLKMATIKVLPKKAIKELEKFGVNLDLVSDKTIPISKRLKELAKINGDATATAAVFGTENVIAGQVLLSNINKFDGFTKAVTGTNVAVQQAAINSNTLTNRWDELIATFKNAVTSTNSENKALAKLKDALAFVTDNMDSIIRVTIIAGSIFLGFKALMIGFKTVLVAYNIVTKAVIAAQWLWNAAMLANPIGLIIIAIAALIALIAIIINKWNDWGAALTIFMGPLGLIISLIQAFRRNWELIKQSFAEGGILAGLKAIGATILDAVLMPLQQLLELMANIPVIGGKISPLAEKLQNFREGLGVNVTTDESGNTLNPDATVEKVRTERIEKTNNAKVGIDINDKSGLADVVKNTGANIKLTKTLGWQGS